MNNLSYSLHILYIISMLIYLRVHSYSRKYLVNNIILYQLMFNLICFFLKYLWHFYLITGMNFQNLTLHVMYFQICHNLLELRRAIQTKCYSSFTHQPWNVFLRVSYGVFKEESGSIHSDHYQSPCVNVLEAKTRCQQEITQYKAPTKVNKTSTLIEKYEPK